jgi:tripartite-type tricarboxylate transporter receptor subunit TctC
VFKGGGEAVEVLLAGTVQLCSGSLAPSEPHIKAGSLRALAISAEARWPDLPDVPTMVESDYEDFVFATDAMLLAPAKTPPESVGWLEHQTLKVLETQDMKDKLFRAGFLVRAKGADAAWTRASREMDTFKRIIDQAGVKKL